MTYQPTLKQLAAVKKHERSVFKNQGQPDLSYLAGADLPHTTFSGLNRPLWQLLPLAVFSQIRTWQERAAARQRLGALSAHALKDLAIDPGQAAFEAEKPFWQGHELRRAQQG